MSEDGYSQLFPALPPLKETKAVTLLIGTDHYIGGGTPEQETRVCITPEQAESLKNWLRTCQVDVSIYVVKDAGVDSGFSDSAYGRAGAQVIDEAALPNLLPAPDVVHSLKEPCPYETSIPGPFMRIGALHTGVFKGEDGIAGLLRQGNFCAVFDGSAVGGVAYRFNGSFPIPLRSSMSVFAGQIAADQLMEHLLSQRRRRNLIDELFSRPMRGKVVIVGGGVVGTSCVNRLIQFGKTHNFRLSLIIVESGKERSDQLRNLYSSESGVEIRSAGTLGASDLRDANGLVLAAFTPGAPAPRVVDVPSLRMMASRAIIIDVSSDEGGSIDPPTSGSVSDAVTALHKAFVYRADTHMPRKYPGEASEAHGRAALPYLATLLYLAAREGGAIQAVEYIRQHGRAEARSVFDALVCDLFNGLAFSGPRPVVINQRVVKDRDHTIQFLTSLQIPLEVMDPEKVRTGQPEHGMPVTPPMPRAT